jgi:NAD(P)-dependent dehydrogenase (short-subunit alcohol dehydrogenase family)
MDPYKFIQKMYAGGCMSKVVIVTGGSRGIGAATARMAGARGYAVCISYLGREDAATAVVDDIKKAGGNALMVQADSAVEKDVLRLFETCGRELGGVTHLVNNAGITGPNCRLTDLSAADLQRVLAVNVGGYFLCAREAVRRMSTGHGGRGGAIVNVSSRASLLGGPNEWIHYAASKGATDTFTVGLAKEVAEEGIRVNAVNPGLIETDIHAAAGMPDRTTRLAAGVPMKRSGAAEEVAETILFLLSDAASYVTGTCIEVSGGR